MAKRTRGLKSISQLIADFDIDKKKYISREFQDYGYRLAMELNDPKHKSLYIKLAKELPRNMLEQAKIFVKDAYQVKSRARLFMWKVKELRKEALKKRNKKEK
ncbi:hypothetical protein COT75_04805 [Candidatus Beckwithbacteria bacterium CG10_big_fil_rev_8_21_14_0_10_34_10]|uniref:Uncharacterized protein n=1 Tax=Candidatus Beckwithbacteria bacterium CG10_big_fil_rev_8_21_14_0_10_34_10 TaxID=1974495 RepID=A0A2H0W7Z0_9BACT|nr:MAG: hypothetical protein COT75_04805 [Candidatus Beckwithbacteria bacterium CG10_big_fil_rev_8_21_14_0_10_34_10]